MEWWLAFLIILGTVFVLFALGVPVAFSFLLANLLGIIIFWGGEAGLRVLTYSIRNSVASFTFIPLVLFILMGSILFQSGMALKSIDTLDKWMGRLPGRLGLLAVGSGVLLSALSGSSLASGAILGASLTPEMEKRGYKKPMSLGPIMGSGGLALMIPPSTTGVFIAALAQTSIAAVLIGGIIPGVMMAFFYASYIIIRCWLQPSIAPSYKVPPTPLFEKLLLSLKYVLPLGIVIFMVTGVIFLGVATPGEAAATGAVGSAALAACYRKLNLQVVKKILMETLHISVMFLMIISGAMAFGQILAFSGASAGLANLLAGLPVPPIVILIVIQIILIFLGMFAGQYAMIMIIVPLFAPIIDIWGMSRVWFCILVILNVEMAVTSPPYGTLLFIMKGVASPDTTMGDIYRAALPFLYCDALVMASMLAFPMLVTWLPGLMR